MATNIWSSPLIPVDAAVVNELEPFTLKSVSSFEKEDLITIPTSTGSFADLCSILMCWRNLLSHIKSQLAHEVQVFDIMIESTCTVNGEILPLNTCLTDTIWRKFLLQGHEGYEEFLLLHTTLLSNLVSLERNLKKLQDDKDLWLRLKIFHYDLKNFSDENAAKRLSNTHHPFFMSDSYFSDEEREFLLNFPISTGLPLKDFFAELLITKASLSGKSSIICSSHDLAPVLEKVLGIRKGYEKEKHFRDALKRYNKCSS